MSGSRQSSAPASGSSRCSTSSSFKQSQSSLPSSVAQALEGYYQGKVCVMTQTRVAADVEWALALPYTAGREAYDLKSLGLVKESFFLEDSSNLVPLCRDLHKYFDDREFMFYPEQSLIRDFIVAEEAQLVEREALMLAGEEDPGRPAYETFYEHHPVVSQPTRTYSLHFHRFFPEATITREQDRSVYRTNTSPFLADEPYFPPISLAIHPNILVYTMTERWANMDSTADDFERAMEGSYLMALWRVTPCTFRALSRPQSLFTSISPLAPLPNGYQPAARPEYIQPNLKYFLRPEKRNAPRERQSHDFGLGNDHMEAERSMEWIQEWLKGVAMSKIQP